MKKLLILAFLFGSAFSVFAQLVLSSTSQIVVTNGSTLVVNSIVNTDGKIDNSGTVEITGNVENNTSGLMAITSAGTVIFNGSSAQEISGDADAAFYGTVEIDNSAGVSIKTSDGHNQTINGTLAFTDGLFTLNEFDLTLTADATGSANGKYVQTNSTGFVKRIVANSDVIFPVGNAAYNPISLDNTGGTEDVYGAKAVEGKPVSFSGTTHIVNESWDVTEAVADGSNLTVTAQWNESDEEATFGRTSSSIGITSDAGANVEWGGSGAATGSNPYVKSQSGFTSVGTFMVGDYEYAGFEIDLKVVLAAAWNSTTDKMDKTLNTAGLIPLTDPYDDVDVTVSAIPADAVDWVKVELRNSANIATVTNTYAKFVDVDGQIIEADGSKMQLKGVASGTYYVAIHHRNHLAVVSNLTFDLTGAPAVNFTNALATAWDNTSVTTNDAVKLVDTGVYGMWNGDANGDGETKYNGSSNDKNEVLGVVGLSTPNNIIENYSNSDLNMDGDVKYNGSSNDKNEILSVVGLSTPNAIKSEHLPN